MQPPQTIRRATGSGFDFTQHMRMLCGDIVTRLDEMRHIDLSRVAVCFSQARKPVKHGLLASLTPLRFADGQEITTRRGGRRYTIQRVLDVTGSEMLYVLTFYLPRFMETDFNDKLVTVLHELWHISPNFDGDLRRHPGRCYAHSHSKEEYDAQMQVLVNRYLSLNPPAELFSFLHLNFAQLWQQHGTVIGMRIARPKLIPLPKAVASKRRK